MTRPECVDRARDADDPAVKLRRAGLEQQRLEQLEQVEVREVIDAEVCFEAVLRAAFGGEANA